MGCEEVNVWERASHLSGGGWVFSGVYPPVWGFAHGRCSIKTFSVMEGGQGGQEQSVWKLAEVCEDQTNLSEQREQEGWNVPDTQFGLALRPRGSTGEAGWGALEGTLAKD